PHLYVTAPSTTEIYTLYLHDALPISLEMQIRKRIMYMEAGTGKSSPCFFRSFRLETVRLRQLVVDHKFIIFISGYSAVHEEVDRSEEHTSELQSRFDLVCRLLLEKKK